MTSVSDWALLARFDAVVNCAGALQDSPHDNLEALHHHAVAALGQAAARHSVRVVQVSAVGAALDSPIAFLSSKARGDAALAVSGAQHVILRPGLVLARGAYGGTGLIRMLAALPGIAIAALPEARLQCVGAQHVAEAVQQALDNNALLGGVFDLLEEEPQSLPTIVSAHRRALGFASARLRWSVPRAFLLMSRKVADGLGYLGWRSPLRSTAIMVLDSNPVGDPSKWAAVAAAVPPMADILQDLNLGAEHRLQARALLLTPICVAILSLFWALSGLVGMANLSAAALHLTHVGWPPSLATVAVLFWSIVDLALAAALLWRPLAQKACLAMAGVGALYLVLGTLITPHLLGDPLGPLVKILPAIVLALVTVSLLEER